MKDICEGNCCFICGREYSEPDFNDEHILPDWILRKYNLHSKMISLSNKSSRLYGTYKIPCCRNCNSQMSDEFETPISQVVAGGYTAVSKYIIQGGYWHIFKWLNLIFLKTHLKDKAFFYNLDTRKGNEKLSDFFSWEELHHIHCVARSFYTGTELDNKVFGSFFYFPVKDVVDTEAFDYRDLTIHQTILLRLGNVAFIAVLNDACAAWTVFQDFLPKFTGPLSILQLREVMARVASINSRLRERPSFHTDFSPTKGVGRIQATYTQQVELMDSDPTTYGKILHSSTEDIIPFREPEFKQLSDDIKTGYYTFLFDNDGNFLRNAKTPFEIDPPDGYTYSTRIINLP